MSTERGHAHHRHHRVRACFFSPTTTTISKVISDSCRGHVTPRLPHLLTLRTVVVNVQHVDVHADGGLEPAVCGHDSEGVSVLELSVQRLGEDQAPPPLALLDDGKLAQRISICTDGEGSRKRGRVGSSGLQNNGPSAHVNLKRVHCERTALSCAPWRPTRHAF